MRKAVSLVIVATPIDLISIHELAQNHFVYARLAEGFSADSISEIHKEIDWDYGKGVIGVRYAPHSETPVDFAIQTLSVSCPPKIFEQLFEDSIFRVSDDLKNIDASLHSIQILGVSESHQICDILKNNGFGRLTYEDYSYTALRNMPSAIEI